MYQIKSYTSKMALVMNHTWEYWGKVTKIIFSQNHNSERLQAQGRYSNAKTTDFPTCSTWEWAPGLSPWRPPPPVCPVPSRGAAQWRAWPSWTAPKKQGSLSPSSFGCLGCIFFLLGQSTRVSSSQPAKLNWGQALKHWSAAHRPNGSQLWRYFSKSGSRPRNLWKF